MAFCSDCFVELARSFPKLLISMAGAGDFLAKSALRSFLIELRNEESDVAKLCSALRGDLVTQGGDLPVEELTPDGEPILIYDRLNPHGRPKFMEWTQFCRMNDIDRDRFEGLLAPLSGLELGAVEEVPSPLLGQFVRDI